MNKLFLIRPWQDIPALYFVLGIIWVGAAEVVALQMFSGFEPSTLLLPLRIIEIAGLWAIAFNMNLFAAIGLGWPDREALRIFALIAVVSSLGFAVLLAGSQIFNWHLLDHLGAPAWVHGMSGVLLMLLLAPVAEEMFFRGIVYRLFRQSFGMPVAIILSAVCFAMMHGQLLSPQLVGGFIFAIAYERSRNLWVPVALHVGANAAVLVISL